MVKLPDPKSKSEQYHMFSEFIGCHIFQILGMLAQKTLLAQYHHRQVRDLYAVEQISLNLREQLTEEIIQS
ncbi:MAG: hypothetical protein Q4A55_06195 [Aerococcus sp.]|nr:hypothetical protein [Aerococcus sp.]